MQCKYLIYFIENNIEQYLPDQLFRSNVTHNMHQKASDRTAMSPEVKFHIGVQES